MTKLIAHFGGGKNCHDNNRGREEVAKRLDIHPTYIWKIAKGKKVPKKHLYDAIIKLCEEMEAENESKDFIRSTNN